ncbi:hypothetical protein ACVWZ4_000482 [Bradyrhizobium sp. USDA 4472]
MKQYGSVRETRHALVTAGEIAETTERSIVQSKQALVVAAADLNKRAFLQLLQPLLQVGQCQFGGHHSAHLPRLYDIEASLIGLTGLLEDFSL